MHAHVAHIQSAINTRIPASTQGAVFGALIRQAIDDVTAGATTGRTQYAQLSKVEKTYVGTRIELLLQDLLAVPRGTVCDFLIDGIECDVKTSQKTCMFPQEALGHVCLMVLHSEAKGTFSVGLWHCNDAGLNKGANQDRKRTIAKAGLQEVVWFCQEEQLPSNFFAAMTQDDFAELQELAVGDSVEAITALLGYAYAEERPVPRAALETAGISLRDWYRYLDLPLPEQSWQLQEATDTLWTVTA
jgi:hypothetical protein